MYSRINYTLVGLFVILFAAAVLAFGFWLAKYGFEQEYDNYLLYFTEPVDGLTPDSTVKLNGVDVGKVGSIAIDPDNIERIRVEVRLRQDTPIVEGMYATLKLQGITGLSYVQIQGGSKGAPRLKASGGKLPVIPTRKSLMGRLSDSAPQLVAKVESSVDALNEILSEDNRKQLERILNNTALATAKAQLVEERLLALMDDFNRTLGRFDRNADAITHSVDRIVGTLDKELPPMLENFNRAGRNVAKLAEGIDKRLQRGEYDLRRLIRPIKIDIRELSYQYQELAEDLKSLGRNPSTLLFGGASPVKGPGE